MTDDDKKFWRIQGRKLYALLLLLFILGALLAIYICTVRPFMHADNCCCCQFNPKNNVFVIHKTASVTPWRGYVTTPSTGTTTSTWPGGKGGPSFPFGHTPWALWTHGLTELVAQSMLTDQGAGRSSPADYADTQADSPTEVETIGFGGGPGDDSPPLMCDGDFCIIGGHKPTPPCMTNCMPPPIVTGEVPEPRMWLLFIIGFALAGYRLRRVQLLLNLN